MATRTERRRIGGKRWLASRGPVALLACAAMSALAGTATFVYDSGGRLTSATHDDNSSASYTLDAAGNRIKVRTSPATRPTQPTQLAGGAGCGAINLSWRPAGDYDGSTLTGYKIYQTSSAGTVTLTTTSPFYTDAAVMAGTQYYFAVSAIDAAGKESALSTSISVTSNPSPTPPPGVTVTPIEPNLVSISWGAASDAGGPGIVGYQIFNNSNLVGTATNNTSANVPTTFSDTTTVGGGQYQYTVVAYDACSPATTSAPSAAITITTPTLYQITNSAGLIMTSQIATLYHAVVGVPALCGTNGEGPCNFAVYQQYGSQAFVRQDVSDDRGVSYHNIQISPGYSTGTGSNFLATYATPAVFGQ